MHFFEFVAVMAVVLGLPALFFHFILRLKASKAQTGTGDALRMSELDAMIQDAVDEAVEPLARRIAELEAQRPTGLLPEAEPLLDLEEFDAAEEPVPVGRRTRA